MKRLKLAATIFVLTLIYGLLSPGESGVEAGTRDAEYIFSASGSLAGIFVGVGIGLILINLPFEKFTVNPSSKVGVLRRIGAMYINLFVVMLPTVALVTLPVLIIEAWHTGIFQWSVYREFERGTDWVIGASVMAVFVLYVFYYYWSLISSRPTIGQYLMGYTISSFDPIWTPKRALMRISLTLLTMCIWPIAVIFALRHPQKAFLFDVFSESCPFKFSYTDEKALIPRSCSIE